MTARELYQWANHHNLEDLPLYIGEDIGDSYFYHEVEVSGHKHEKAEDEGESSECCGAERDKTFSESGICGNCKEHAEFSEGLPERIFLKS